MSVRGEYKKLIDPDLQQFIKDTQGWYPDNAVDLPISQRREFYNALCKAWSTPRPSKVDSKDFEIIQSGRSISCRRYTNKQQPVKIRILYFHGGGFVLGGLESHDGLCAQICQRTGFELISVDYKLAPEHCYPADILDARAVYDYLLDRQPCPTLLLGDSAGASIAASLSHHVRNYIQVPVGQVLIYPMLGNNWQLPSFVEHANAPMLSTQDVIFYARMRCGSDLNLLNEAQCSPLNDPDMSDLPPTFVFGAEFDPLHDDGKAYCDAINAAGGAARFVEGLGLVHSWLLARNTVHRASSAFNDVIGAVIKLGQSSQVRN
ncbi:MAG: alpha/beta hydrolase [Rhizobiaceae bacterium]